MKSEPLILVSALSNAVAAPNVIDELVLPICTVSDKICASELFTTTVDALKFRLL